MALTFTRKDICLQETYFLPRFCVLYHVKYKESSAFRPLSYYHNSLQCIIVTQAHFSNSSKMQKFPWKTYVRENCNSETRYGTGVNFGCFMQHISAEMHKEMHHQVCDNHSSLFPSISKKDVHLSNFLDIKIIFKVRANQIFKPTQIFRLVVN